MTNHELYDSIYSRDNPNSEPYGWLQWKGTNVCIDLHCSCGHHGHFDGFFLYYFECPQCHKKYAMGQNVKMIPLTGEEIETLNASGIDFKTCDLEEEE